MKIVTVGPEGTFSHQAALQFSGARIVFAHSIHDVFDLLKQGLVDCAVVPLENSSSGTVYDTLDHLIGSDLLIQQEIILPIVHHLVSFLDLKEIQRIYTCPHTYEQCREHVHRLFALDTRFGEVEIVYTASNAMSGQELLKNKENGAALLSEYGASLYEIPIVKAHMHDALLNETRFILVGHTQISSTGKDRTSLIFLPNENRKGLLSDILSVFSNYHLNLTKIESRPSKKQLGAYFFYMDFEGHMEDLAVQKALEDVQKISPYRFLGSYPRQF